jgi:hypothetical protein
MGMPSRASTNPYWPYPRRERVPTLLLSAGESRSHHEFVVGSSARIRSIPRRAKSSPIRGNFITDGRGPNTKRQRPRPSGGEECPGSSAVLVNHFIARGGTSPKCKLQNHPSASPLPYRIVDGEFAVAVITTAMRTIMTRTRSVWPGCGCCSSRKRSISSLSRPHVCPCYSAVRIRFRDKREREREEIEDSTHVSRTSVTATNNINHSFSRDSAPRAFIGYFSQVNADINSLA